MARLYSNDLRERIGAAVRDGTTVREAAELFNVSAATAVWCGQRLRACGSAATKAMGGAKRDVLVRQKDWLRERIKAAPDLTLDALVADRGLRVGRRTVWKFCRNEKLTFKKLRRQSWLTAGSCAEVLPGFGEAEEWAGYQRDRSRAGNGVTP